MKMHSRPTYRTKAEINQMLMTLPVGTKIRTEGWLTGKGEPTPFAMIILNSYHLAGSAHSVIKRDGSAGKATWHEIVDALWGVRKPLSTGGVAIIRGNS